MKLAPAPERRLHAERLLGPAALREAQALRFRVFIGELKAKLKSAEHGLDEDGYDAYCEHIGVRDLNSGQLVATTRLLDHQRQSFLLVHQPIHIQLLTT